MKKKFDWKSLLLLAAAAAICVSSIYYYDFRPSVDTKVDSHNDQKAISFGWWGNDERHVYTLNGVRLFEEKHPDITVKSQYSVWSGYERRYRIYMLSDTAPDVMLVNYNWLKEYSPTGTGYYDLNDLKDVIDLSSFTDAELGTGTVNGHLNALPTAYNAVVFYYNETIFSQYGLSVPKTWEDLKKAAQVLYPQGIYPLYMNEKHFFLSINAHYEQVTGKRAFDDNGSYIGGTDAAEGFLSFYRELVDSHVTQTFENNGTDAFQRGEIAGAACWASDADRYCSNLQKSGYSMVLGNPPAVTAGDLTGWYEKPATMYAIRANTQNPREAAELLDFLVNDPDMARLQGTEKGIPVSSKARDVLRDADALTGFSGEAGEAVIEHISEFSLMNPSLESESVLKAFKNAAGKYFYGIEDLDTAAGELADKWTSLTSE